MIWRILTLVNTIVMLWLIWAVIQLAYLNSELGNALVFMAKVMGYACGRH